jgi:CBS domain-containing protein
MKAADVMVSAVISVRPNARVEEVASILKPHQRRACDRRAG